MEFKLNTVTKTIEVTQRCNAVELLYKLQEILGDDFKNYSIQSGIYYNSYPVINPEPWVNPSNPIYCSDGFGNMAVSDESKITYLN